MTFLEIFLRPCAQDSLANLVKSLVKHRGRLFRRIALRNFSRKEFFSSALKIFVSLFCPSFYSLQDFPGCPQRCSGKRQRSSVVSALAVTRGDGLPDRREMRITA
jgi:hypothetical protein